MIESASFRSEHGSDWLHRTDKFLPVGRFEELLIPRVSIILLLGAWVWVWRRGRDWVWLAAIATAALLLLNQTVVTGLQIENVHWNYAIGPPLSLLVVMVATDLFGRLPPRLARSGPIIAWAFAVTVVAAGGWLYARAAAGMPQTVHIREAVSAFHAQMDGRAPLPGACVAGDLDFQYLAAVGFDLRPLAGYTAMLSPISDTELDTRVALNAYLLGWSRERFVEEQNVSAAHQQVGVGARSEQARSARLEVRLAIWDGLDQTASALVERFNVRVIATPLDSTEQPPTGWIQMTTGPRWVVWTRAR